MADAESHPADSYPDFFVGRKAVVTEPLETWVTNGLPQNETDKSGVNRSPFASIAITPDQRRAISKYGHASNLEDPDKIETALEGLRAVGLSETELPIIHESLDARRVAFTNQLLSQLDDSRSTPIRQKSPEELEAAKRRTIIFAAEDIQKGKMDETGWPKLALENGLSIEEFRREVAARVDILRSRATTSAAIETAEIVHSGQIGSRNRERLIKLRATALANGITDENFKDLVLHYLSQRENEHLEQGPQHTSASNAFFTSP